MIQGSSRFLPIPRRISLLIRSDFPSVSWSKGSTGSNRAFCIYHYRGTGGGSSGAAAGAIGSKNDILPGRRRPMECPGRSTVQVRTMTLSVSLEERLLVMQQRHEEILQIMNSAGHTSAALGKELSRLSPTVRLLTQRQALDEEESSLRELLLETEQEMSQSAISTSNESKELIDECVRELELIAQRRAMIDEALLDSLLPVDDEDHTSDAILEIRAGTGGDEASLFAKELLECYKKSALALSFKVDVLTESPTDIGGIREASIAILSAGNSYRLPSLNPVAEDGEGKNKGDHSVTNSSSGTNAGYDADNDDPRRLLGSYGTFKYESGVHRVQRIPINADKIHTSACSVAVLPSLSDDRNDDSLLPAQELKIETMRASGAGGQHVNTTDSAVRITHLPTKITASIQDERSQHKNKAKALRLITARVREHYRAEEERARGETRSSLMGGGDRSERIRTYNYPQDRVTDHRSKDTRHGIVGLMSGALDDNIVVSFLPMLKFLARQEELEKLLAGDETNSKKKP